MARTAASDNAPVANPKTVKGRVLKCRVARCKLYPKRVDGTTISLLELVARQIADEIYTRLEEAHNARGNDPKASRYDDSTVATVLKEMDLGGGGNVILHFNVRPNTINSATLKLMNKSKGKRKSKK